jgi:hypothetical protein
MLDIFQSDAGERSRAKFAPTLARRGLTLAGELGTADEVRGFALNSILKAIGMSSATAHRSQSFVMETNRRKLRNAIGENHGRKD